MRFLLPTLLVACAAPGTTELSAVGFDGRITFELTFPDGPAHAGTNPVELVALCADEGLPIDALDVALHGHMPAMDHDSEEAVLVEGEGRYAGEIVFTMPGAWQLHVQAFSPGRADAAYVPLDVE